MRILFLMMAGLLLANPALAGQSRGGSPDASTDEYDRGNGNLDAGSGIKAGGMNTADLPRVNIQPKINADGTLAADPDANAKLQAGARPVTNPPAPDADAQAALITHNAPAAPGGSVGTRGMVGQERSHGSGLN